MSLVFYETCIDWDNTTLYDYLLSGNIPRGWEDFFTRDDVSTILYDISTELSEKYRDVKIYPDIDRVFRAFIPLEKIRCVILGQDPYHDGAATGICFSVSKDSKINPSLRNIYKQLDSEGFVGVRNGSLNGWKDQGCLMLNTALTVVKGRPDSHILLWRKFTEKLLKYIAENTENIAWLLMGNKAINYKDFAGDSHQVFCTSHPSPFSANKKIKDYPAFIGCNVFTNINKFLKTPINW